MAKHPRDDEQVTDDATARDVALPAQGPTEAEADDQGPLGFAALDENVLADHLEAHMQAETGRLQKRADSKSACRSICLIVVSLA